MSQLPARQPRSQLTFRQQHVLRDKLMHTASLVCRQIHEVLETGKLVIAEKEIEVDVARLKAWNMVLNKTIPDLRATEITHKTSLGDTSTDQLLERLVELAKERPELQKRLSELMGVRVIEGKASIIGKAKIGRPPKKREQPVDKVDDGDAESEVA